MDLEIKPGAHMLGLVEDGEGGEIFCAASLNVCTHQPHVRSRPARTCSRRTAAYPRRFEPETPLRPNLPAGFSLVELLVTIAIVTILTAIMVPVLVHARDSARGVMCRANLHQWGLALAAYTQDNDHNFFGWPRDSLPTWLEPAGAYVQNQHDLLLCASARLRSEDANVALGGTNIAWIYNGSTKLQGSYCLNGWVQNAKEIKNRDPDFQDDSDRFWRNCLIKGADNVPVLADGAWWWAEPESHHRPPERQGAGHASAGGIGFFCIDRHDGAVNALFMDWSVRTTGLKQLWTLKWHRRYDTAGPWTKAGGVQSKNWPLWMRQLRDY